MQKNYALFDFDGTLIPGDSIVRFCWYAYRRGLCGVGSLLRCGGMALMYLFRLVSATRAKQSAMRFIAGHSVKEMAELSGGFCDEVLVPLLYPEGLAELARRRREGLEVLLVTASPAFYLEPLRERLGIAEIIGTRMDAGTDGVYTGLICGENCRGLQKPLRLAEYLAAAGDRLCFDGSCAYGDSGGDHPMLMLCAHKVAVNPKRKLLRALKGAEGVTVVSWRRRH